MDSDCEGELACFQRDEWDETPVPGCSGRGIMGTDYCFDPLLHPNGLREFTSACTTAEPCGKCQGVSTYWRLGYSFAVSTWPAKHDFYSHRFRTVTGTLSALEISNAFSEMVRAT